MSNDKKNMYPKIYGRICEKYGSQKKFAEHMGVSEVTVSSKMQGKSQFSRNDIIVWSKALEIDTEKVGIYFFGDALSKNESEVTR